MTFPFRFYGVHPAKLDAAGEGRMFYELRFVRAPDAAARLTIARRFELAIAESAVDGDAGTWAWSGAWASFFVGVRRHPDEPGDADDELRWDDFFDAMGEAFEDVHAAESLVEVVLGNARAATPEDRGGDWEAWSVRQQKLPGVAPAWKKAGPEGVFAPQREAAAETQDLEFERERARIRKAENVEPWWAKYLDE